MAPLPWKRNWFPASFSKLRSVGRHLLQCRTELGISQRCMASSHPDGRSDGNQWSGMGSRRDVVEKQKDFFWKGRTCGKCHVTSDLNSFYLLFTILGVTLFWRNHICFGSPTSVGFTGWYQPPFTQALDDISATCLCDAAKKVQRWRCAASLAIGSESLAPWNSVATAARRAQRLESWVGGKKNKEKWKQTNHKSKFKRHVKMRVEPNIGLMMKLQNHKAMLQSLPAFLVDQTWAFIMLGCWSLSSCHLRFGFFFASFASLSLWSKWKVARVFGAFDRFATALHWNRLIQLQRRGVTKVSSWNAGSDEFQTFVWGGHIFWIFCWDKPTDLCLYFKPNLLRNNVFSLLQTGALEADFPFPWVGHVSSLGQYNCRDLGMILHKIVQSSKFRW